ncbi:MAG: hypothetical protein ACRD82_13100, partial [Blastocatellia bacterium]
MESFSFLWNLKQNVIPLKDAMKREDASAETYCLLYSVYYLLEPIPNPNHRFDAVAARAKFFPQAAD